MRDYQELENAMHGELSDPFTQDWIRYVDKLEKPFSKWAEALLDVLKTEGKYISAKEIVKRYTNGTSPARHWGHTWGEPNHEYIIGKVIREYVPQHHITTRYSDEGVYEYRYVTPMQQRQHQIRVWIKDKESHIKRRTDEITKELEKLEGNLEHWQNSDKSKSFIDEQVKSLTFHIKMQKEALESLPMSQRVTYLNEQIRKWTATRTEQDVYDLYYE